MSTDGGAPVVRFKASDSVVARAARTLVAEPRGASFWTLARAGRLSNQPALHHDATADEQEQLLGLVQRLFLPLGTSRDGLRSVVFATPAGSYAANLTAVSVAETLARHTQRSVCLVDANLRDPFLHRRFGVGNSLGLADIIVDPRTIASAVVRVEPTLWVLAAGQRVPGRPVAAAACARAVDALHSAFDIVVMCACSHPVDDESMGLAQAADGVVLVIDETVHRETARRSVVALQSAACRVSGVVLGRGPRPTGLARLFR